MARLDVACKLQKDNAAHTQRSNVLESENKLLLSETEQLREVGLTVRGSVDQGPNAFRL